MKFDFEISGDVIIIMPYDSDFVYSNEFEINTENFYHWVVNEDMYEPSKARGNEWNDIGDAPLYEYASLPYETIKYHIEFYLADNPKLKKCL
jgi:hypothetical protein